MSVHPSNRLPAAAGDALSSSAADASGGGGGDLFNSLVSGMAETKPAAAAADADADADADAAAPSGDAAAQGQPAAREIPESVEQLLALVGAGRTHAAGKTKDAPSEPDAKAKKPGRDGTGEPPLPTPPAMAAAAPAPLPATAMIASPTAAASPPATTAGPVTAAKVPVAAPPAVSPAATTLVPAAAPQAASPARAVTIPAPRADSPAVALAAALPAEAPPAAAPPPSPADPAATTPKAQPPAAAPQPTAPTADPAAAIRSLLAEAGAPGERRRSERTLPVEAAAPLAAPASARQADQPAALAAAPAAPAPAPMQPAAQAAAPAAPLQGLVIERQLDLAHQKDWIDQLARDITTAAAGDGGALRFRLNPEHLGTLHVEIAQSHHGAAVRFSADSEAARAIIADAQPRLVAEARAQGVRISEAHVDLGSGGSGDPRRQQTAPADVPLRTARSLQEDRSNPARGGKPTRGQRELYA